MRNKTVLALILAVALILFGAFLPKIVGSIMDRSASNKMEFAEVSDIQLEFVQSDMPMEEIMSILCKGTHSVEVPQDLASHSASDIQRLAQQAISHYQDAGLISHSVDIAIELQSCVPNLVYQQASSRKSNIFWHLVIVPADNSWSLEMDLDDRTGRLCSINYIYHVDPNQAKPTEPIYEDLEEMLLSFSNLFLRDLGDSFAEMDTEAISAGISTSVDEDYASATVTWEDTIKGECHMIFYLLDTSFYTIYY